MLGGDEAPILIKPVEARISGTPTATMRPKMNPTKNFIAILHFFLLLLY
jgi:hypothetical protein